MTTQRPMDHQRYLELLQSYGANFERWPTEERAAARRLWLASRDAQQARREAEALDQWLDQSPALEPSEELKARILEIPERHHALHPLFWWPFATVLRPTLAFAAAALLGIATGSVAYQTPQSNTDDSAVAMTSEDWNELTELAFAAHLDSEEWP
jgi:hypothetical protein